MTLPHLLLGCVAPLLGGCLTSNLPGDLPGDLPTDFPLDLDTLETQFREPPDSARPWTYWFVMDGNFTREGITADLASMKEAGLGGVILMEVNVGGIPRGPVEFMSDEWRALFAHAVREAERLGLEITLNAGPGWTGSGGPWIEPAQSMQHLVASETNVEGPILFDDVLPVPPPRPHRFGEGYLTDEMKQARLDFYADEAVLAFPDSHTSTPRNKWIDEHALYKRDPYTSVPGVRPYIASSAGWVHFMGVRGILKNRIIDLADHLDADGRLRWQVPEGRWTILRFVRRDTGADTRPAPRPGLGFECDKFSKSALEQHFEAFITPLLEAVGPRPANRAAGWTNLHIDSWEMGSQNWTAGFRDEFTRRRGYDPLPYLPALTGRYVDNINLTYRFLWDLRLTGQELVIENHASHLKTLAHRHGFELSIEPYDMNPTADLVLGAVADVPMGEFWAHGLGFDSTFSIHEAVSVGHSLGRPIIAAEAFTALPEEAWQLYPAKMKNQGDWALASGINRIVFHRFAHQPWLDRRPGMTQGPYGTHWERTQTFWPLVGGYHRYLARCQFLLRQGEPVADVAYLIPESAPHVFLPPPTALAGELGDRRGHDFVAVAPDWLYESTIDDGRLVLPGGLAVEILVLPAFDTMTLPLLRRVAELLEAGATVVGLPPLASPGLTGFPEVDKEIRALSESLWVEPADLEETIARPVGLGRILTGGESIAVPPLYGDVVELYPEYDATATVLAEMGVAPDFESDAPLRYDHRRLDGLDLYFVGNRTAKTVDAECLFRVTGCAPELWDPIAGTIHPLRCFEEREGRTVVPLRFEAHQSYFLAFPHEPRPEDHFKVRYQGCRPRRSPSALPTPPPTSNFLTPRPVGTLDGSWTVWFDPTAGGPGEVSFPKLIDWSTHEDPAIRHYSGIARYETTFDIPFDFTAPGTVWSLIPIGFPIPEPNVTPGPRLWLDLGEVPGLARVKLNGHDLGTLWCAPWHVDITFLVQSHRNELEIEVANLWPNRLIGDLSLPEAERTTWSAWNPFTPQSPLLPSGLLGPVTLVEGTVERD